MVCSGSCVKQKPTHDLSVLRRLLQMHNVAAPINGHPPNARDAVKKRLHGQIRDRIHRPIDQQRGHIDPRRRINRAPVREAARAI